MLIFTGFDPECSRYPAAAGPDRYRLPGLRAIADRHSCDLVDLWSMRALQDRRAWSPDRLHLSSEGHRRVAQRTCEVRGVLSSADPDSWPGTVQEGNGGDLAAVDGVAGIGSRGWVAVDGVAGDGLASPPSSRGYPAGRAVWLAVRRQDAGRARQYAMPWVRRRLAGAESDRLDPKRPDLLPVGPGGLIR